MQGRLNMCLEPPWEGMATRAGMVGHSAPLPTRCLFSPSLLSEAHSLSPPDHGQQLVTAFPDGIQENGAVLWKETWSLKTLALAINPGLSSSAREMGHLSLLTLRRPSGSRVSSMLHECAYKQ